MDCFSYVICVTVIVTTSHRTNQNTLHTFYSGCFAFSGPKKALRGREKEGLRLDLSYSFAPENICRDRYRPLKSALILIRNLTLEGRCLQLVN